MRNTKQKNKRQEKDKIVLEYKDGKKLKKGITLVSLSYNHEEFVSQALDSFVNQRLDIPYKIIVSDDCSNDRTDVIINAYAEKYPHLIIPIIRKKNIGVIGNYLDSFSRVDTEYVAYCECDDFFTDPYKLQKQVDFLEQHPDCSICFHKTKIFYEDNSEKPRIAPTKQERFNKTILDINDLLKYNFVPSNSVVYRWRFTEENIYEVFPKDIMPADYYLHLLHAEKGKIGFIDETMTWYRKHKGGTWYDSESVMQKHGVQYLMFYMKVWNKFANKSETFFKTMVFPLMLEYNSFINNSDIPVFSREYARRIRSKKRILIILAIMELVIILAMLLFVTIK